MLAHTDREYAGKLWCILSPTCVFAICNRMRIGPRKFNTPFGEGMLGSRLFSHELKSEDRSSVSGGSRQIQFDKRKHVLSNRTVGASCVLSSNAGADDANRSCQPGCR